MWRPRAAQLFDGLVKGADPIVVMFIASAHAVEKSCEVDELGPCVEETEVDEPVIGGWTHGESLGQRHAFAMWRSGFEILE
jgi:hypothetical protein